MFEELENHRSLVAKNINESFEKARSGIYADTSENRKLGRVGMKYGEKKKEEQDSYRINEITNILNSFLGNNKIHRKYAKDILEREKKEGVKYNRRTISELAYYHDFYFKK